MRLIPRSLFARNLLLLFGLILLSQLFTLSLWHSLVVRPRLNQLVQLVALQIDAARIPLTSLSPSERDSYLRNINRSRTIKIHPARGPVEPNGNPPPGLMRGVLRQLSRQMDVMDVHADVVQWRHQRGAIGLRVQLDGGDSYWFDVRTPNLGDNQQELWIGISLSTLVLAFLGATLIQRFVHRPVRHLITATSQLGEGRLDTRVDARGATEIVALANSFNQMAERLCEAEQNRQIMLAGVSHDLRSPLAKLRLSVEILENEIEEDLRERMIHNIETMDAVIGQFLDFARSDSSEALQQADLNDLLRMAIHTRDNISLDLHPVAPIMLRPNAINRVITNLLDNAERYGLPPFVVSSGTEETHLWFTVRDHGPGIDDASKERLLEPFERGDSARGGAAGAGLGLAIVARIVALHDGELRLETPDDGGLAVTVRLPLPEAAPRV